MALIGSAEVEIVPSVRSFSRKVEQKIKPEASKLGDDIGNTLGEHIADKMGDKMPDAIRKGGKKAEPEADKVGNQLGKKVANRLEAALKRIPDFQLGMDMGSAEAQLGRIKNQIRDLGSDIDLGLDSVKARAGIDAVKAQLAELDKNKNVGVGVRLDAKKAELELDKFMGELRLVDGMKVKPDIEVDENKLERFRKKFTSLGEAAYNNNRNFRALAISSAIAISPGLIPLAEASGAAITVLAGAVTAAGIGFASFALVSVASWKKIADANKEAMKGNLGAFDNLTKQELQANKALQDFQLAYSNISTKLEPITLPIETRGLQILTQNMHLLEPVVIGAASGFDHLEDRIDAAFKSKTMQEFVGFVQRQAGPSISAFTDLFLGLGSGIGSALQQTEKYLPDLYEDISNLGTSAANFGKSEKVTSFLQSLSDEGPKALAFIKSLGSTIGTALTALAPTGGNILQILTDALPRIADMLRILGAVTGPVTHVLAEHAGVVQLVAAAYIGWKAIKIADMVAGLASGLLQLAARNPELAALAVTIAAIGAAAYVARDGLTVEIEGTNDGLKGMVKGVDALNKVTSAVAPSLGTTAQQFQDVAQSAGIGTTELEKLGKEYQVAQTAMKAGLWDAPAIETYRSHLVDVKDRMKEYVSSLNDASPASAAMAAAMDTFNNSLAGPEERLKGLIGALATFTSLATGTLVSQAAAYQAIDSTVESLKKANLGQIISNDLSKAKPATLDAAQGIGTLRQAIDANVAAFAKGKVSAKELIESSSGIKKSFVDQAVAAGLPRAAVQKLADKYLSLPKKVLTQFAQTGADGVAKAADNAGNKALKLAGKTYKVTFDKQGDIQVAGATDSLQKKVDGFAKDYTAYLKQNGSDGVVSKVDYVQNRLNGLNGAEAIVQINARDNVTTVVDGLARLNGRVIATQYVDITTRNRSTGHVDSQRATLRADGGPINGQGGPRQDNIPLWASNGEYIINAEATKRNRSLIEAINSNKFASGGLVGSYASGGSVNASAIDDLLRTLLGSFRRGIQGQNSGSRIGTSISFQRDASVSLFNKQIDSEADVISKANDRLKSISDRRAVLMKDIAANPKNNKLIARDTAQLNSLSKQRVRALDDIAGSKSQISRLRKSRTEITGFLNQENRDFQKLASQRQSILNKAAEANQYGTGIRQGVQSSNGLLSIGATTGSRQIIAYFRKKVSAAKSFNTNVRTLAKRGVSRQILSEMIEAGPDGAGDYAQQLAHAPGYDLKTLNKLQGQLNSAAGNTARTGVGLKYGMQNLGKSFVDQLNGEAKGLAKVMDGMADRFAATLKRKLNAASGAQRRANGGLLSGPGSGTSDSIPVDASNGEFIVNARSTSAWLPVLKAINGNATSPASQQYSNGGVVASHGSTQTIVVQTVLDGKVVAETVNRVNNGINKRIGVR